jgi:hypothetical protein
VWSAFCNGTREVSAMSIALRDYPVLLFVVAIVILYAMVEVGFRIGQHGWRAEEKVHVQFGAARDQAGVLLSLLLGFVLAMALERYDLRKEQIVEEANAIGTTRLRAQLLPEPLRAEAAQTIDEYIDARIEFANAGIRNEALSRARSRSSEVQRHLWAVARSASAEEPTPITALFVQSLNQTIDAGDTRLAGLENRVPRAVWIMIATLAMLTALLVGLSLYRRSLAAMVLLPVMFSVVALIVADLDTPDRGLIPMHAAALVRLKER